MPLFATRSSSFLSPPTRLGSLDQLTVISPWIGPQRRARQQLFSAHLPTQSISSTFFKYLVEPIHDIERQYRTSEEGNQDEPECIEVFGSNVNSATVQLDHEQEMAVQPISSNQMVHAAQRVDSGMNSPKDFTELQTMYEHLNSMMLNLKSIVDASFSLRSDVKMASKLLPVAALLDMPTVSRECDSILKRDINVENCISLFKMAHNVDELVELRRASENFILLNFAQVWKHSSDFPNLSLEDLQRLLFSDYLAVDGEEDVFKVIVHWIQADFIHRRKHIYTLIDAIRLPSCGTRFLHELLKHPLLSGYPFMLKLKYHVNLLLFPNEPSPIVRTRNPRRPEQNELVIFALGGRTSSVYDETSFETFDPVTRKWIDRKDISEQPRGETLVIPMVNEIYVVELDSERVRSYNPLTRQWQHRSPLPLCMKGTSIASVGSFVYIMGGYSRGKVTHRCFVYDYSADRWNVLPSMRYSRSRSSATAFQGKIYCSGGRTLYHKTVNYVESYDPSKNEWRDETPMLFSRWGHSLVSCPTYIWAFGGCLTTLALSAVERYHPQSGQWIQMPSMPTARRSISVTIYEGLFYVIGGIDRGKAMRTVEVYDPKQETWERRSDLCKARGVPGTCVFRCERNSWCRFAT